MSWTMKDKPGNDSYTHSDSLPCSETAAQQICCAAINTVQPLQFLLTAEADALVGGCVRFFFGICDSLDCFDSGDRLCS